MIERGLDQEVMTEIEKVGQDIIEAMKIAIQEVIIEGVEIVDQKVMIEEIEIVDQEVMIEEIEILPISKEPYLDRQVEKNQISSIMQGKEIQKLFKEFLNQKLNSDNISLYIDKEDLLGQNHSRPQERSSQKSLRRSNQGYSQIQDRTSPQEGSSSSNVRFKYLDLTDLPDNLLAALRKRKNRANTIEYLVTITSKTDEENPTGEQKVIVKDLKWRSDTTPDWTISGYEGSLKTAIQNACAERSSSVLPQ
ncbi:19645_t:CDS:2 [Dentiscutata erythropus]|uniref:19645_t:CDS:1 n=1 Tax=Dentiscutata erythropus TaxID=1348616 RepID=A0A9N9JM45_9GLOM|nr:19645_t:CDS:2 [Dentiscutata erythropus]